MIDIVEKIYRKQSDGSIIVLSRINYNGECGLYYLKEKIDKYGYKFQPTVETRELSDSEEYFYLLKKYCGFEKYDGNSYFKKNLFKRY